MSTDVSGLNENPKSPSIDPIVPMLPPPTLPWLVLALRPLVKMPGRFNPLTTPIPLLTLEEDALLPFRSAIVGLLLNNGYVRGKTEITNLSLDIVSTAGSNLPLALILYTLMPRKSESGTDT
jgi:hypothetical protein